MRMLCVTYCVAGRTEIRAGLEGQEFAVSCIVRVVARLAISGRLVLFVSGIKCVLSGCSYGSVMAAIAK